jgi:sigma-B regulation protein RsbU (phosphoserine phosphatase)
VTAIGASGSLLGVLDEVELHEAAADLGPGDALVAYTDGVTEARAPDGDFYGDARLIGQLVTWSAVERDLARSLLGDVLDFQHGVARDDIAIVAVRVPMGAG